MLLFVEGLLIDQCFGNDPAFGRNVGVTVWAIFVENGVDVATVPTKLVDNVVESRTQKPRVRTPQR